MYSRSQWSRRATTVSDRELPMARQVCLWVEVAGCPTICQHCWAQGTPYPAMPLADIAWVLEQGQAACAAAGVVFLNGVDIFSLSGHYYT